GDTKGGTVGSRTIAFSAAKVVECTLSPAASPGRAGPVPAAGKLIIARAPACTAPAPGAAPAMARSSGDRFSPGMSVSANASSVATVAGSPGGVWAKAAGARTTQG